MKKMLVLVYEFSDDRSDMSTELMLEFTASLFLLDQA